ncbi:MAG: hypothetical protein U0736_09385 [Gemmataceae bacterium]
MIRYSLVLAVVALVGCRTWTGPVSTTPSGMVGGPGTGNLVGEKVDPAAEKSTVTAVLRLRLRSVLAKIGIDAKGKAAPAFKAWADGIGVPMDAVDELTLVAADGAVRSARLVTTADVDRNVVRKACKGLQVTFESDRAFTCSRGAAPALDERIQKQLRSVGTHDVVVWGDGASLLATVEGMAAGVKDGLRDGTLTIDLGDETEAAARLNFKDEAAAVSGAKVVNVLLQTSRMFLLQITAQLDLAEVLPGLAGDGASREEMAAIRKQYGLLRHAEPALRACKAVPRGTQVPLYVRMPVPLKTLGELVEMADSQGVEPTPCRACSSGRSRRGRRKRLARPMPPGALITPYAPGRERPAAAALARRGPHPAYIPVPPPPMPPVVQVGAPLRGRPAPRSPTSTAKRWRSMRSRRSACAT